MRNLTIVFHDAGGGHRNAALALKTVLEQQDYPWNVRLLNLQELLDPIDVVHRATGHRLQDGYNLLLRKGWTRLTPQLLVLLQCTIRLHQPRIVRMLRNFWAQHPADLVLSVIPHFNVCLAESIRKEIPSAAFVTVLTDLGGLSRRISGLSVNRNIWFAEVNAPGSRPCRWGTPGSESLKPPG